MQKVSSIKIQIFFYSLLSPYRRDYMVPENGFKETWPAFIQAPHFDIFFPRYVLLYVTFHHKFYLKFEVF